MGVLSICPTRGRPKLALRLYDSWKATVKNLDSKIVFYVSRDDESRPEYERLLISAGAELVIGERMHLVDVINKFVKARDYKYYNNINDDHIYRSEGWDIRLAAFIEDRGGWGCACPKDLFSNWEEVKNPSGEVVSGNIIKALGHYFLPGLLHLGADEYLKELMDEMGLMWLVPDVITEHCHPYREEGFKGKLDSNYRWVYSPESDYHKKQTLSYWRRNVKAIEQKRIINAMRDGASV